MPEELWDAALVLAVEVGANRAALELGFSYPTLKRRLDAHQADALPQREPGSLANTK